MGMYDTFFFNGNIELQLKTGDCGLSEFHIGDKVNFDGYEDGIYLCTTGYKGVVVIWGGVYVASFDSDCLFDKYGNKLDFNRVKECAFEK